MAVLLQLAVTAGIGAIISTIPLGPINVWLLSLALSKRHWRWWAVTIGVVIADCTVAIGCLIIKEFAQDTEVLQSAFQWPYARAVVDIFIATALIAIGVSIVRKNKMDRWSKQADLGLATKETIRSLGLAFVLGFIATVVEPGLAPFWLAWWLKFIDHAIDLDLLVICFVMMGIVAGDVLVFGSYRVFAVKLTDRITLKNFGRIEMLVGIVLMVGASLLLFSSFQKILRGFLI
ncbi:MAG: hypothetical protein ACOH5I_21760 [Oligoflexus sp.]